MFTKNPLFVYIHGRWQVYPNGFPPVSFADEDGLAALGGDFTPECFLEGYLHGFFPWPMKGIRKELIPWFSPDPRFVLEPNKLHVSHSLRRTVNHDRFTVRADTRFEDVIRLCSSVERADHGTWITRGIIQTFCELHRLGYAHSVECYVDGELAGGFYGTCYGHIFGGESMFTLIPDSSKVAFVRFARRCAAFGIPIIDCQCYTDNMSRYGAHEIPRTSFLEILDLHKGNPLPEGFWHGDWDPHGETCV